MSAPSGSAQGGPRLPQVVASWPRWFNFKPAQWRTTLWLVVAGVAGLVLLAARPGGGGQAPPAQPLPAGATTTGPASSNRISDAAAALDRQLAAVLEQVVGAGQVTVAVDLTAGPEAVFATNTQTNRTQSQQTPPSGGSEVSVQQQQSSQVVLAGSNPVVAATRAPTIAGVLVVATGASDPEVAAALARAAQTATGVPLYRVTVLAAGGGEGNGATPQGG